MAATTTIAAAAEPKLSAAAIFEVELSQNGAAEPSVTSKAGTVAPHMTRDDDAASNRLRGGGLTVVTGCPLQTDDNFCRYRCCCCDNGCTKFALKCQWYCIKLGPGGCAIEKNCPLASNENFCRFMCLCCDSGCRKLELVCQILCLKCTV